MATDDEERQRPGLPAAVTTRQGEREGSLCVPDLPADDYHALLERQSCSMLKPLLISPAHYLHQFLQRKPRAPAMDFGSLVHLLVLEPHRFPQHYAVVAAAGERLTPAERQEARALYPGLQVLTEVELHQARQVADRVLQRSVRGRPFYRYVQEGQAELTFFYDDPVTGLACRTRVDLWHPDALFDLKTTRHATVAEFARAGIALHYDLQAYMYCLADAMFHGRDSARDFVFLAVQSSQPHPVHLLAAGETFMANGQAKYSRAIALLKACMQTGYWPDNSADEVLEIEPWQAWGSGAPRLGEPGDSCIDTSTDA